ncbi:MAG: hypothetical protein F6J93_16000 [Oscillatoria sp. SIO1A7]|nr:hypothetical protein [Oscillatoria sp. SIO1A7]
MKIQNSKLGQAFTIGQYASCELALGFYFIEELSDRFCQSIVRTLGRTMQTVALKRISKVIPHHVVSIGVTP